MNPIRFFWNHPMVCALGASLAVVLTLLLIYDPAAGALALAVGAIVGRSGWLGAKQAGRIANDAQAAQIAAQRAAADAMMEHYRRAYPTAQP
jgi:hypothetical protein